MKDYFVRPSNPVKLKTPVWRPRQGQARKNWRCPRWHGLYDKYSIKPRLRCHHCSVLVLTTNKKGSIAATLVAEIGPYYW